MASLLAHRDAVRNWLWVGCCNAYGGSDSKPSGENDDLAELHDGGLLESCSLEELTL